MEGSVSTTDSAS